MSRSRPRVMAISSGGGHWIELRRLTPAFEQCDVHWVTVECDYGDEVGDDAFHIVTDATRWNKLALCRMVLQIIWLLVRLRPDVVVTTGAAPGYAAVRFARYVGARTVWLDSIANADELSMSGRMAGQHADLWMTQWAHLAGEAGPEYAGAVL